MRIKPLLTGILIILAVAKAPGQVIYEMTVAKDGSGDYTSIQEAINNTKAFPDKRIVINVRNGVYEEKVKIHSWNNMVTLRGESREGTIITFDDHFKKIGNGRNSTFHTWTLLVEGNDFIAENLTIRNTAGLVGQALALAVTADRCVFVNCRFVGNQDTLYLAGEGARQYFVKCEIEGTVDFIFGEATAVFDRCRIIAKSNSYITAASTPEGIGFGFVFINCEITAENEVEKVYLGRPWRVHAKTVFLGCDMGDKIHPEGWHNWSKPEAEATVYYGEFHNSGPGFQPGERVEWSHQLTREEASQYTLENILSTRGMAEKNVTWYACESCR